MEENIKRTSATESTEKLYLVIWECEDDGTHEIIAKHIFRKEEDAQAKMYEYKKEIQTSGWFARHEEGTDYDMIDSYNEVSFKDYDGDHAEYITMEEIEVE